MESPAFRRGEDVNIFHVTPSVPLAEGAAVYAGQPLGAMTGSTLSDVAVSVDTPQGYRLVSWFDVISDTVFEEYRARGVAARDELIIFRAERDAEPLTCDGEAFTAVGTRPSWVRLR